MATVKKLLSFLTLREKYQVLLLLLGMFLAAGMEAGGLGLFLAFILAVSDPAILTRHELARRFFEGVGASSDREMLVWAGVMLLAYYVLKNTLLGLLSYSQFRFLYKRQARLSSELLTSYLHRPYTFHLQRNTAELLRNVNNEVLGVYHNVVVPLLLFVSEVMVTLVILIVLMIVDPVSAFVAFALIGGLSYAFFCAFRKQLRILGESQQYHEGQMIKWVNQSLGSVKETLVLGRQKAFVERYEDNAKAFNRTMAFFQTVQQLPRVFVETVSVVALVVAIIFMIKQNRPLDHVIPTLVLFGMAAVRLMPSMSRMASMMTSFRYFTPAVDVVYQDLHRESESDNTSPHMSRNSASVVRRFRENLKFEGVSYRYPGAMTDSVKDVSFTLRKGQMVALVGASGAGKSTLVDILLGLLPPTSGKVLVDGRDIHEDLAAWQDNIGYVSQTTYLLDDSILRNIALGISDVEIDVEKVRRAVKSAQLEKLVQTLPQGLDTIIGERGCKLSGGERQRIGIARALYHDPDILILDEPTSSLDYETEREITRTLEALKGRKTVVIVAHRLSTVRNCDEVYEVTAGSVEGPRTFESLEGRAVAAGDRL